MEHKPENIEGELSAKELEALNQEKLQWRRERIRKQTTAKIGAVLFSAWVAMGAISGTIEKGAGEKGRSRTSISEVLREKEKKLPLDFKWLTDYLGRSKRDAQKPEAKKGTLTKGGAIESRGVTAPRKEMVQTQEMIEANAEMERIEEMIRQTEAKMHASTLWFEYYPSKFAYRKGEESKQEKMGMSGPISYVEFVQWVKKRPEAMQKEQGPTLQGFELANIKSEEFEAYLKAAYPKSWLQHISSITYTNRAEKMGPDYGPNLQDWQVCGEMDRERGSIEFFADCKDPNKLLKSLSHELGHSVDWNKNKVMSLEERLQFQQKVLERVVAPDRFVSEYVESIRGTESPKEDMRLRAGEYWAVIVKEYFAHPPNYWNGGKDPGRLSPKDLELIKWFFAKTDPDFDVLSHKKAHSDYVATKLSGGTITPPKLFIQTNHKPNG
ncbi:MAG: hypothetical protein A3H69_05270 [Candidatus Sungbacteria bacterium RIFCSPLOWO2_02_FULL_47_9]|uniref:Uncharacterized protein n=1 Tax=Candidatus Sungbacteria bacterium RIFCSPHIGHO2_01_FULL_47_32 TaxID=1802264 RepID=A0A1G2K587_9BACT|nr:MAG: hypothetical protein A2633_01160 [Candidatus Sungbacteria bacterium RIFCSPHIGHO2_01_FULL_47_32]OHA10210.1 MAG: hypothetical protein A3H69_05270 [Candidatus Sungbacteria bacterium RIFCSPLOWO2_02_FULL_47_9]